MKRSVSICLSGFSLLFFIGICFSCVHNVAKTGELPRSVPEKEGVSSRAILGFVEAIENSGQEWHSFVLLRHGKVIAEGWWDPYCKDLKQTIYSTSKTFTSTAIGFAVSEQLLSVEDPVISFFPDLLPDSISPYLAQMKVKHLLSMTAGQNPEPSDIPRTDQWVKRFLSTPVVDEPGTKFLYNSVGTYMLSAIIQKVSGQRVSEFLASRLFEPLAIEGYDWEISPEGINTGGWGLRVHTEDMAKLGQLYLQQGKWEGKQLLPESWIAEATTAKIDQKPQLDPETRATDDWAQGYCYQIWRCRNQAFRADGAYGQYIIVMPEQDAVLSIQANLPNMQAEINLVWDYLLPALQPGVLPIDKDAEAALQQKLTSLSIQPNKGVQVSQPETDSFTPTNVIFTDNELQIKTLSLQYANDVYTLTINGYPINFGKEQWVWSETKRDCISIFKNPANFSEFPPFKVCGSYCRQDEQTLEFTLRYMESPHAEKFIFRYGGDKVQVSYSNSINSNKITTIEGNPFVQ